MRVFVTGATGFIGSVIGERLRIPVVSKSREEAAAHFRWIGNFFTMDAPASSAQTQERLGWRPVQPGLIADLGEHYFEVEPTAQASPVHG